MIICFKCSPDTKSLLDEIFKSGQYEDYSELITSALGNLKMLQNELSDKKAVVIDPEKFRHLEKNINNNSPISEDNHSVPKLFRLNIPKQIPEIFGTPQKRCVGKRRNCSGGFMDFWTVQQIIASKGYIWASANLIRDNSKGINLDEAGSIISEGAAQLGDVLLSFDTRNEVHRDDKLSLAFPSMKRNYEKSKWRYINQFLAMSDKNNEVHGLLIDLKLICHSVDKNIKLQLTEAGWYFSQLENPVLDNFNETSKEKFSSDELKFLIGHIKKEVRVEDFAYKTILSTISNGNNTPEKIDSILKNLMGQKKSLSDSSISTQRSGVLSRMIDLGLVSRKRDGIRVTYEITDTGFEYLKNKK